MKNTISNLIIIILLIVVSLSCAESSDDLIPTDLTGNKWNCISLEYNGNLYDTHIEFSELNKTKDFVSIDFKFNSDATVTLYSIYTGSLANGDINNSDNWISSPYQYSISGGVLKIDDNYLEYEIVSNTANTLKLKMTKGNADMPIGGTYTLTR
jgi:hypothetical protein